MPPGSKRKRLQGVFSIVRDVVLHFAARPRTGVAPQGRQAR